MAEGLPFLDHGGEAGRTIAAHNWSNHPLGPAADWPAPLRFALGMALGSSFPSAIYWGPELRLFYNDAWIGVHPDRHPRALGLTPAEVWGESWDAVKGQFDEVLGTGAGIARVDQAFMLDGAETWWSYSITPIRDENGAVLGVFNQGHETTRAVLAERERSRQSQIEAALLESEERLELALHAATGIGSWDWSAETGRVTGDLRFAELFGIDPERVAAGGAFDEVIALLHPDDRAVLRDAVTAAVTGRTPLTAEFRVVRPDGAIRWVLTQGRVIYGAEGQPLRFPGVSFDITERKAAEEAARTTAQELRRATEAQAFLHALAERQRALETPAAVMRFTAAALARRIGADRVGFYRVIDGGIIHFGPCYASNGLAVFTGTMPAERLGETALDHYRSGRTLVVNGTARDPAFKDSSIVEHSASAIGVPLLRGGSWVSTLYVNQLSPRDWTPEETGFIEAVAELSWDAVERIGTAVALKESESQFRAIANSIDQMVWSTRPDGYHDYYNDRWYEYTGVPHGSTDGEAWNGMFHPEDQERAWEVWRHSLETGEPYHIEYRLRRRDGAYRWVLGRAQAVRDGDGAITRWFGTCTDIQEIMDAREVLSRSREELERAVLERTRQLSTAEAQLRQAQKMEAVGQLTGGIAHDFNNMLAVVIGALDLLERRIAQGRTDVEKYVTAARDGATRAAALTQRLLAFSRQQPLAPAPVDVNLTVMGMLELLVRTIGEEVSVETRLPDELRLALADPGQLENVLLNLSVNARDAMPGGGVLTIETSNVTLDEDEASGVGISPGDYVQIAVRDTGEGMPPDVAARAFDPFFTTKGVGKGTGLGLSQVFGFVRQSGGHVALESEVGNGTTVRVYLPVHEGPLPEAQAPAERPRLPRGAAHEAVLVVEDEDRVRAWSVEALRELGYTVVDAHDGPAALRLIEGGQRVDLLFTDIVMPEMTGRELARRAAVLIPGLRTLFTSGYSREEAGSGDVLPKPFALDQLAHRVRAALDA
ncbi:PAS domain-containing protein [Sphingomonas sp. LB-2]|uniref:PAS domain-containing protein n=1 Tax=Sphingomonas caeni TaxID=2984949 RepID=UPI002230FC51|nr:PAS domain-containing protein [Sphingomonas caeni]MCW3846978.1 PAS domain-containing protein [Sphingomonas caeni]